MTEEMATTAAPRTRKKRAEKNLLDREAWLDAAAEAVAEGGFGDLRILVLAKKLGVTRGSFYWHFADHEEFVRAFLDRWLKSRMKRMAIWSQRIDQHDPEKALLDSIDLLLDAGRTSYRNIRIELAVRDFAMRDTYAAEVLAKSDDSRHAKMRELFFNLGGDETRAGDLALLLKLLVAGADVVLHGPARNEKKVMAVRELVAELFVQKQKLHTQASDSIDIPHRLDDSQTAVPAQ